MIEKNNGLSASANKEKEEENDQMRKDKKQGGLQLGDQDDTIDALAKALTRLRSSQGSMNAKALLQDSNISDKAMDAITAFLQGPDTVQAKQYEYEGQSGGAIQLVVDLKEKFEVERTETATELQNTHAAHLNMIQQLTGRIKNLKRSTAHETEQKAAEMGLHGKESKVAAQKTTLKNDLSNQLSEMNDAYTVAKPQFESNQKRRTEEISAVAQAGDILQKANSLLQMPTMQATSLVQVLSFRTSSPVQDKILSMLNKASTRSSQVGEDLQLITETVRSGAAFDSVIKLINNLINKLVGQGRKEQDHKNWCDGELSTNAAARENSQRSLNKENTRLDKATAEMEQSSEDVETFTGDMTKANRAHNDATAMRLEANADFNKFKADKEEFIEALTKATDVLQGFYGDNQDAFIQAENEVFLEQPSMATGGVSAYGENEKTGGVMQILEVITTDESNALNNAISAEDDAQSEYKKASQAHEVSMAKLKVQIQNGKTLNASARKQITESKQALKTQTEIMDGYNKEKSNLDKACIPKVVSHEERMRQRQQEIDTLKTVLEVLGNAD